MNGLAFFDTNVLVYTDDLSAPEKRRRSIDLFAGHLRRGTAVLSLQVLQEYFAAATRRLRVAPDIAQQKVTLMARGRVVRFDTGDIIAAIELHRLTQISFWDAMIVHAARLAGAAILYTEDLQPGAALGGVRVVNPFSESSPASHSN